ncbi:HIT family protein [Barrientosiimonas endolithica]|uniref:HIT family protein n=1 Tax=Barrientosiimonas endolithica TaxID=1535208 RepID=UPI00259BCC45|nr:hypothetical protein [Barrientosiimonas endolithica]
MAERPCVFCAIVAGDTAADVVLETDRFVAFLDARPVFKGTPCSSRASTWRPCSTCPPSCTWSGSTCSSGWCAR